MERTGVNFFLGIDGLNVWLVLLTAVLMLPCVLVSFKYITDRVNEYYAWLLALQTTMIGVFLAFDVVIFYTFFELTLVPLFFLIGIWGGAEKLYAARKFFIYTLTGSLITLLGVLVVVVTVYSNSHPRPERRTLTVSIPELVAQVNRQLAGDKRDYAGSPELAFASRDVTEAQAAPFLSLDEAGQQKVWAKANERERAQARQRAWRAHATAEDRAQARQEWSRTTDREKADARHEAFASAGENEQKAAEAHASRVRDAWAGLQILAFLAMSVGFAVKVPLMPFHTWLPLAHTEAPTAGSVDLAGVLLKLGCYGFLRLCIPLAPDAAYSIGVPLITWLGAIGIIYGALCAFAQDDVKKLIAYSSVSHLGVVMLGMFSLNLWGLQGSMLQMINHGLSTPLLFLLIGMLYERYHTRKMADYSGMAKKFPLLATFLVFACLSSAGLPGLNGFVGEVMCLIGIYTLEASNGRLLLTALGATGMLLGAWYLWTMLRRVLFGPVKEPHHEGHHGPIKDLSPREWGLLVPLVLLCFVLGVFPRAVLKSTEPESAKIEQFAKDARERAKRAPAAPATAERAEAR
jgi:NADH-quinone oxidoreductase subunit M